MRPGIRPVFLLLFLAAVPSRGSEAPPVRVMVSDAATGVEFEYTAGAPERTARSAGEGGQVSLRYRGASLATDPGQPETWVRTERVLLPPGADYHLEYEALDPAEETGIRLARVPGREEPPPSSFENRFFPEDPLSHGVGEFRGRRLVTVSMAPAQYNPATRTLRTWGRFRVRVSFTPGAGRGRTELRPDPAMESTWSTLVLNPEVDQGSGGRLPVRPSLKPGAAGSGIPAEYFDDAAVWIRMRVRQNGLYRITRRDLETAGLSPGSVDPARLRIFSGPGMELSQTVRESAVPPWGARGGFRELAVYVSEPAGANGRLDEDDVVLFYGLGVDNFASWYDPALGDEWVENQHTSDNVYWLTPGGSFSGEPLRMSRIDARPAGAGGEITAVRDRIHYERNEGTTFDPLPKETGVRWEKWFWQTIGATGSSFFWDLDVPEPDSTREASLLIRWWGANWPWSILDRKHHLCARVNDLPEACVTWGSDFSGDSAFGHHDQMLTDFTVRPRTRVIARVIKLEPAPPPAGPSTYIDQVHLAWFELTYWKRLSLASNRLWFDGRSAETAPARFRVASAAPGSLILDVSEPWNPVLLEGNSVSDGAGTGLVFEAAGAAERRFFLGSPAGYLTPLSYEQDRRPARWLRDTTHEADYIAIAWDDFLPAAEAIADWRQTHLRGITEGLEPAFQARTARTMAVRVSDIYDEFSGGLLDPTAIRNFVQYAFDNWSAAPAYIFLIGDANRDTRNYEGTSVQNLLPTWQDGYDSSVGREFNPQYSTDDYLGRLDGPDDRFTDFIIGRVTPTAAGQALTLVRDKIIRSETFRAANPARSRIILVADDVCQVGRPDGLGNTHLLQTERVDRSVPSIFDRRKIYLYDYGGNNCAIIFKPSAKRDLINAMNEGAWCVNYIGHGGDQQIADEKVLETTDVASLANLDHLPNFIGASCSVGKFDRAGSEGLAEVLVKSLTGGCITTMAATHLSFSGENQELNEIIMEMLFPKGDNRSVPPGEALFRAKNEQARFNGSDRQRKYLLLGDPASPLVTPRRQVRFTEPPETLLRGTAVTVAGEVLGPDLNRDAAFTGTVDLLVQDQPEPRRSYLSPADTFGAPYRLPGATIFAGRIPVSEGRFTATFVVPVSLRGGSQGRIRAYASSDAFDVLGAVDPIVIGGMGSAPADSTAPAITLRVPSGVPRPGEMVEATIQDESGINLTRLFEFRSILFTVSDEEEVERYRADVTGEFNYLPGSHTTGSLQVALPNLPPGRYALNLTATDNFNNRGQGTLEVDLQSGAGDGFVSRVFGLPNPFGESTQIVYALSGAATVRVSIFSVSGRKVREWSLEGLPGEGRIDWNGLDEQGDPVANGVYLVRVFAAPEAGGKGVDRIEPVVRIR